MDKHIIYILIWEVLVFVTIFSLMFYALQALDFSKIFKQNSTTQIKIVIMAVSASVAFGIASGIGEILKLIIEI
ncbi:MAG: DUF1146 family protein [Coprobacillus sp.]|nr:DUF1146 family protein [Coprobacillus sp.]MDY4145699.1 DUF1146 family protein [Bacilli bacterium]CCY08125.1 unknown [Coprobacillus sp. CAG:698]